MLIVVDKSLSGLPSLHSLSAKKDVENGWVFAVDPDYTDPGPIEPLASKVQRRHRDFVRVQLQDLLGKFFVLRKYRECEKSMEGLWKLTQKEGDWLFVPTTSEYQQSSRKATSLATRA